MTAGLRILLLEDSNLDAELTLRELRQGGVHFVSTRVQNGDDFQQAIRGFLPDLILARLRGLEGAMGRDALILRDRGQKVGTTGFSQFEVGTGAWILGGACSGRVS